MHSEHREPLIRISKRQGMPFWKAMGVRLIAVARDQVQAAEVSRAYPAEARRESVARRDQGGAHIDEPVFVVFDKSHLAVFVSFPIHLAAFAIPGPLSLQALLIRFRCIRKSPLTPLLVRSLSKLHALKGIRKTK